MFAGVSEGQTCSRHVLGEDNRRRLVDRRFSEPVTHHASAHQEGVMAARYVNAFTDAARLPEHSPGVSSPTWPR
jgi:hypothetical protein